MPSAILLFLVLGLVLLGKTAVADTTWATATGERDGKPIVYRYIEKLPPGFKTESQPELIQIVWRYSDGENGMPGAESNERQIRFEDLLEPLQSSLATLALVWTGAGEKSWVYYTSDTDPFMRRLNELLAGEERFPIEIEFQADKEWSLYWSFWRSVDRSEKARMP